MRSRVRAVLMAAALMGSGTWAQAQCTKDTECKGDRVCDAGQCTTPAAAPAPPPPSAPPAAEAAGPAAPASALPVVQLAPVQPVAPLAVGQLAPTDQPKRRRSPPIMVGGIVMTAAAPVVWLVGFVAVAAAQTSCLSDAGFNGGNVYGSPTQVSDLNGCRSRATTQNYLVLIGGAALLGAGIPMIVYGAKKVPDTGAVATVTPWLARDQGGLQLRIDL